MHRSSRRLFFSVLAHALGTPAGAFIYAGCVLPTKMKPALGIGVFFLIGGIANVHDTWVYHSGMVQAYIPMGWLGGRWAPPRNS